MAGFVISPNTIRVLWHVTTHGRPQLYVTHAEYSLSGPLNPNIADTIFDAFKSATAAPSQAEKATTFSWSGVGVIDLRAPNNVEILSGGTALPGTGTEIAIPDQVSICVTLRTGLAGRSFRGRVYTFGWVNTVVMADGTISDAGAATAVAEVTNMKTAIAAAGAVLAIRSPALPERPSKPGGTLDAKPFAITPVTLIECRDRIFDTNRRRIDTLRR